ncbi:MAG: phospholipase [Alphaproteobacteria bacterium]|nr:phospholipase [Alphaproteobacteria bacterium]
MSIQNYYEQGPKEGTPKSIVIMLHGVGSNGQDLISLAPMLSEYVPHAVFISPDAPFPCDMVPLGYPDSYQWFSLQDRDPSVMLIGVKRVQPLIEEFIEGMLEKYGLAYENLVLLGFSQGTMTSLYVAPRLTKKIAGVLGYSGALLGGDVSEVIHKMPIHLVHGEADDVVSVEAWGAARKTLTDQGFAFSGHTSAGLTHSIDIDGIRSGGEFLKQVL